MDLYSYVNCKILYSRPLGPLSLGINEFAIRISEFV